MELKTNIIIRKIKYNSLRRSKLLDQVIHVIDNDLILDMLIQNRMSSLRDVVSSEVTELLFTL